MKITRLGNGKRYRFQIQFDVYCKDDLSAVKKARKIKKKVHKHTNDCTIIWGAESPFASMNQRELDINELIYNINKNEDD